MRKTDRPGRRRGQPVDNLVGEASVAAAWSVTDISDPITDISDRVTHMSDAVSDMN